MFDAFVLNTAYTVSAGDMAGLMETFSANAAVIVPIGVGLVAALLGIKLIPKIMKSMLRG